MRKTTFAIAAAFVALAAIPASLSADYEKTVFFDDFESYADNAAVTAAWGANTMNPGLTTGESVSGSQAMRTTVNGTLIDTTAIPAVDTTATRLSVSAYIYDALGSGSVGATLSIGVSQWTHMCVGIYHVQSTTHYSTRTMGGGPNWETTTLARTPGWHKFTIVLDNGTVEYYHNDEPTPFHTATYTTLAGWGPWLRIGPAAAGASSFDAYYDDVEVKITMPDPDGTYVWNGSFDSNFLDPNNWTPARVTTATTDTLVFDGDVTPTAVVTGLASQTVNGLWVRDGAEVSLTASAAATLSVNNGDADYDFQVGSGSSLRLTGTNAIAIDIAADAKGEVKGDVIFAAKAASVTHRINANAANAVYFRNGSTAAMAPNGSGAAGGFGNASQGFEQGVIFEAGATYFQGGEKDLTFNGGTGSNPFGRSAPAANVVFKSGSTYHVVSGVPATSGRTYGNYIWQGLSPSTQGGGSTLTILNDFKILGGLPGLAVPIYTAQTGNIVIGGSLIVDAAAPGLNLNPAPTNPQTISIAGNVDLQTTNSVTLPASANTTVLFNGTAAQDIDFGGLSLRNAAVNNPAGVNLAGNLNITGDLRMIAGEINPGAYALTFGPSASVTRDVDAAVAGSYTLPLAPVPVSFNVTAAGTGTGTVTMTTSQAPTNPLPAGPVAINRAWNLTASGITGWTATLVFNYLDSELGAADESKLVAARYNGTAWEILSANSTVDTVANTVTVTGVTELSEWTLVDNSASVRDWQTLHLD